MPDEKINPTTPVPAKTLDWWRGQLATEQDHLGAAYPYDQYQQRQTRNAYALSLLLAATDHDNLERIAHEIAAVRQVLAEMDGR